MCGFLKEKTVHISSQQWTTLLLQRNATTVHKKNNLRPMTSMIVSMNNVLARRYLKLQTLSKWKNRAWKVHLKMVLCKQQNCFPKHRTLPKENTLKKTRAAQARNNVNFYLSVCLINHSSTVRRKCFLLWIGMGASHKPRPVFHNANNK